MAHRFFIGKFANEPAINLCEKLVAQRAAFGVAHFAGEAGDRVDDRPNTAATAGAQLRDSQSSVAEIESPDAVSAEEQTEQPCHHLRFVAQFARRAGRRR